MRYLREMIDIVRIRGLTSVHLGILTKHGRHKEARSYSEVITNIFYEGAEKAESFVFAPSGSLMQEVEPSDELTIEDIPFSSCSFEMLGIPLAQGRGKKLKVDTLCLLIYGRGEPGQEEWYVFAYVNDLEGGRSVLFLDKDSKALWQHFGGIFKTLLTRLRHESKGVEQVRASVKLGSGRNKRTHRIRRIIHVCSGKDMRKIYDKRNGCQREIDWKQRWIVTGCWRTLYKLDASGKPKVPREKDLSRIGKDRAGNYCVPGKTWVVDNEKGPEDKPLIKKTRYVSG